MNCICPVCCLIEPELLDTLFYYVGNIVKNLQGRYDGITRKSTAGCLIAEGDFLFAGQVWHRQQKIPHLNSAIDSIFYYSFNTGLTDARNCQNVR